MRSLPAPPFGVQVVLGAVGTGPRIDNVRAIAAHLLAGEAEYLVKAAEETLWTVAPGHAGIDADAEADVRYAFDSKMSDKNGPARTLYNALKRAPYNRCPICMERDIGALDHFLPQERWPRLAIVPSNLVPICTQCNIAKRALYGTEASTHFLHPYFDDLGTFEWLSAVVEETPGAPLTFDVFRAPHWDDITMDRVEAHFIRFGLGQLFATHAVTLLASYAQRLDETLAVGGPVAVRLLLQETARSFRKASVDLWSALAMDTWAASDWFCRGGWVT